MNKCSVDACPYFGFYISSGKKYCQVHKKPDSVQISGTILKYHDDIEKYKVDRRVASKSEILAKYIYIFMISMLFSVIVNSLYNYYDVLIKYTLYDYIIIGVEILIVLLFILMLQKIIR